MEALTYIMAIFGCGDMATQCEQVRVDPTRYESLARCEAAIETVLPRHSDLSYPTIAAHCMPSDEAGG